MLIYRVQHEKYGYGPYHLFSKMIDLGILDKDVDGLSDWLNNLHSGMNHPTPQQDGIEWDGVYFQITLHGFESMEKLETWFSGCFERLSAAGFQIVIYDVPLESVKVGNRQVVFDKEHARVVSINPLKELAKC